MSRLVIISGCSGGGKSTLLEELGRRGHAIVEEPGRRIVREELPDGEALPWRDTAKFVARLVTMSRADLAAALEPRAGWVFFDRGLIDASIAQAVVANAPISLPTEAARFNRVVFLAPPWREIYRTDPERRHSFEDAVVEHERQLAAYPALGFELAILPKVSVQERADFVCEALAARAAPS